MQHQMRAEYRNESPESDRPSPVKTWHMVRDEEAVAMCGRALRPGAKTLSEEDWGRTAEPACHTCGALYLREVP